MTSSTSTDAIATAAAIRSGAQSGGCGAVARNDPYKGVQLIARIGQPQRRRHSLQIEIRRPLYMDETTRERNDGFARVQRDLAALLHTLAAYVRDRAERPYTHSAAGGFGRTGAGKPEAG